MCMQIICGSVTWHTSDFYMANSKKPFRRDQDGDCKQKDSSIVTVLFWVYHYWAKKKKKSQTGELNESFCSLFAALDVARFTFLFYVLFLLCIRYP